MRGNVFDPLARRLASHRCVTVVDLPGYGASTWQPDIVDLDTLAAAVAEAVPDGAAVLGWSLGGLLALELAGLRDIEAVILISSTPRFAAADDWRCGVRQQDLEHFRKTLENDPAHCLDDFVVLSARGDRRAAEVLRKLRAIPSAPHAQALRVGLDILAAADLRAGLTSIDVPAFIVAGGRDSLVPPAAARFMAAKLPRGRLYPMPEAAHAPFIDREAELAPAIDAFLAAQARMNV